MSKITCRVLPEAADRDVRSRDIRPAAELSTCPGRRFISVKFPAWPAHDMSATVTVAQITRVPGQTLAVLPPPRSYWLIRTGTGDPGPGSVLSAGGAASAWQARVPDRRHGPVRKIKIFIPNERWRLCGDRLTRTAWLPGRRWPAGCRAPDPGWKTDGHERERLPFPRPAQHARVAGGPATRAANRDLARHGDRP